MILKLNILLFLVAVILAGNVTFSLAQSDETIASVVVDCVYPYPVPAQVVERLNNTLLKTIEKILVEKDGRSIESYINNKTEIELGIIEGLNIVLEPKGYRVVELDIDFAIESHASFKVEPIANHVKTVKVELGAGNFHPFWSQTFKDVFEDYRERLIASYAPYLIGLPIGAEDKDWAYGFVSDELLANDVPSQMFSNMDVIIDVNIAEPTIIKITPTPSGTLVKTLRVRAYSRTLYQMLLDPFKETITSNSNMVVGMPVELIQKHHEGLEAELQRLIHEDPLARKFHSNALCRLYFVEHDPNAAYVELKTESERYNLRANAMVDVGNDVTASEFETYLGAKLADYFEIFAQMNFFPDDITLKPDFGVAIHPFTGSLFGVAWDFSDSDWKLLIEQYISRDIRLEAEIFRNDEQQDQYGIVYKPFQYISFGAFTDWEEDYWLRTSFAF